MKTCECGCGTPTGKYRGRGRKSREFKRFVHGHNTRGVPRTGPSGPDSHSWRGGARFIDPHGYVRIWTHQGQRREHRVVAERVLGKPLPPGAQVHHVNGDKTDNRPQNLVICQDNAYHFALERRQRALDACGNANWLRCPYCKQYDAPERMYIRPDGHAHHLACCRSYKRMRREATC